MAHIHIYKTDYTEQVSSATSTSDISDSNTYGGCVLVGFYYTKPSTTGLQIRVTLPNGTYADAITAATSAGLVNGFNSLLWPIVEGSTIAVTTTGGVSGDKYVTLVFLPNRGSAV